MKLERDVWKESDKSVNLRMSLKKAFLSWKLFIKCQLSNPTPCSVRVHDVAMYMIVFSFFMLCSHMY